VTALPDVYAGGVVTLNDSAARLVVAAINELGALAARNGGYLPVALVGVRNAIAGSITHAATGADTRAPVDSAPLDLPLNSNAVVDTATAARRLGVTPNGIRWLCQKGRLDASHRAGRWWITTESLDAYRARPAS
jgi:hypothetical protein